MPPDDLRLITLKYGSDCDACGTTLNAGEQAYWSPSARGQAWCQTCGPTPRAPATGTDDAGPRKTRRHGQRRPDRRVAPDSHDAWSRLCRRRPRSFSAGARHRIPFNERASAEQTVVSRSQEVSTDAEQILHDTVNRREPLELSGRREPPHLALTLSGRLMGDLRAVIRVLIGAVKHRRHHRATGGRVTAQLVGDQASRHLPLVLQQLAKESHRGVPISSRLHEDVQDVTVLIHGAPQVLLATLDRDEHLVEMPGVSEPATSAPSSARILRTEPPTPLPDGLIGDVDTPAGQHVKGGAK